MNKFIYGYNCKDKHMSTYKIALVALVIGFVSGCSSSKTNEWFVSHTGNMPSEERISQISKGDSQEKVLGVLGSPSSVVSLDKNTWIYMSSSIKKVAFFAPKEVGRDVLTIRFNDQGKVIEISRLDEECGEKVAVSQDKTDAPGEQQGFFRKYFGGVGQYNPLSGIGKKSDL